MVYKLGNGIETALPPEARERLAEQLTNPKKDTSLLMYMLLEGDGIPRRADPQKYESWVESRK